MVSAGIVASIEQMKAVNQLAIAQLKTRFAFCIKRSRPDAGLRPPLRNARLRRGTGRRSTIRSI